MKVILVTIIGLIVSVKGLEPKIILNQKVEVMMPSGFGIMPEEMLKTKYPSGNRPTLVYSNAEGTVNLAVNHTQNKVALEQLPQVLPVFVGQFTNLYPSATWYRKEMTKINDRDFVVLELITPAIDTRIYNLMFITELEGRMLMFSFNCTEGLMGEWKPVGNQIMQSVKIQ